MPDSTLTVPVPGSAAASAAAGDVPETSAPPEPPAALLLLGPEAAAAALAEAGEHARGFLGLDPVTDNEPLLAKGLTRLGAQVLRSGTAILGYTVNPDQPRQARVAATSADPAPLAAFLAFLARYRRCTSFVAQLVEGSDFEPAFAACGFTEVGRLRAHRFQSGRYHDVRVLHTKPEEPCLS